MSEASTVPLHRYEKVAEHLRQLIELGGYGIHDRLPSVRNLSLQQKVSITTVLEAYRLLEDQGLVEARPQSGYYVSVPEPAAITVAAPAPVREDPVEVGMGEFLVQHLRDFQRQDLVQFGAACPNQELLPTQRLARCLAHAAKNHSRLGNQYDLPPGYEPLRQQIARRSQPSGFLISADEVVLTLGCQESLILCLRATCQAGDTVAIETPTFYGHLQAIEMLGLKALEIPADPVGGVSLPALRQALDDVEVRCVLLSPCYSNPTGSCMSEENKQELVELLAVRQIPLIEDDIFGELSHSPHRPRAARSYDREGLVLLCSSFSKTLAPGYRVGWVVAGPRYLSRIIQLKLFTNLASPGLTSMAISEFLENGGYDHHLRQCRRLYARLAHQMADVVVATFPPGTTVTRPQGGFVLWVQLPTGFDSRKLYPVALEQGITIGPGPIFSARGRFRNCIRLCAPYWGPGSEPSLRRFARLLNATQQG